MANITAKTSTDGKNLIITVPLATKPEPSKSGKTLVVGTTAGFMETDAKYKGKTISLSLNATIKP